MSRLTMAMQRRSRIECASHDQRSYAPTMAS